MPDEAGTNSHRSAELQAGSGWEVEHSERNEPAAPRQNTGAPRKRRASAFTADLDRELQGCAEAAIEAFRLSFNAALAEGSPVVRQRLRQAASDLMRVAARTTIVLDRLNAGAGHASMPPQDHWRHTG